MVVFWAETMQPRVQIQDSLFFRTCFVWSLYRLARSAGVVERKLEKAADPRVSEL